MSDKVDSVDDHTLLDIINAVEDARSKLCFEHVFNAPNQTERALALASQLIYQGELLLRVAYGGDKSKVQGHLRLHVDYGLSAEQGTLNPN